MSNSDLVHIIGNFSRSLPSVQHLVTGVSYVFGVVFMVNAISKFREIIEGGQQKNTKMVIPASYLLAGVLMIYLPSTLQTFSNTLFGSSNALSYSNYNPYDIYSSMYLFIQTAGLIWFVRGCVLLAHASSSSQGQEGQQSTGPKGLTFIFAGILAMNFNASMGMIDYILSQLMSINLGKVV